MSQQSFRTVSASLQQTDVIILIGDSTPMLQRHAGEPCARGKLQTVFQAKEKLRAEALCPRVQI